MCQRGLANDPATSGNRWILAAGPGRATLLHYHRSHDVLLPAQHLQEERARIVRSDAKQKKKEEEIPPASCCYAARKTYQLCSTRRKGETQLKFYLISGYARTKAGRRTLSLPCLSRRVAKSTRQKTKRGERERERCAASARFRDAFAVARSKCENAHVRAKVNVMKITRCERKTHNARICTLRITSRDCIASERRFFVGRAKDPLCQMGLSHVYVEKRTFFFFEYIFLIYKL